MWRKRQTSLCYLCCLPLCLGECGASATPFLFFSSVIRSARVRGPLCGPLTTPHTWGSAPRPRLGYGPRSKYLLRYFATLVALHKYIRAEIYRAGYGRRGAYRLVAALNDFGTEGNCHLVSELKKTASLRMSTRAQQSAHTLVGL